jgi:glycosyltransferase involved in cell wall biosynthesis
MVPDSRPIVASMTDHSVLHLLGPSTGGIRRHVAELAHQLNERGWPSSVAGPVGVMAGLVDDAAVVDVPASWNPAALVRAREALAARLAGTAILHAHGLKAALVSLSLGRRQRPPIVVTLHNDVDGTHAGSTARLLSVVQKAIVRRADQVIVLSKESLERSREVVDPTRLNLVMPVAPRPAARRTPQEVRREYGLDLDAPLVVVAARLHPQKDLSMFLHAFALVRASLPNARALVVGDGPERATLERTRAALGLEESVVLAGHVDHPADAIAAADVVAVSSRWEAGPLVSVECLQLGRPLVTTATGSVSEQLVDRTHARITPVGDTAAFATALVEVLTEHEPTRAMAEAGRRLAGESFDPEALVLPVVDVYEAALAVRGRSRSR